MKIISKTADTHSAILRDGKFWKLAHHKNQSVRIKKCLFHLNKFTNLCFQIRGAWYKLAGSVCRYILPLSLKGEENEVQIEEKLAPATKILLAKQEEKFCTVILGKLDDPDPLVAPSIWEAALHLVNSTKVHFLLFYFIKK